MLEIIPIMLALCFMLSNPCMLKNDAGIIDSGPLLNIAIIILCSLALSYIWAQISNIINPPLHRVIALHVPIAT